MTFPLPPNQANSAAQVAQIPSASADSNEPRSVDSSSWGFSTISSCCSILDDCSCGCLSAVKNAVVRLFSWCAEGLTAFYNWLSPSEMPVDEEQVEEEPPVQELVQQQQVLASGQSAMQALPGVLRMLGETEPKDLITPAVFLKKWEPRMKKIPQVPSKPAENAKPKKQAAYEKLFTEYEELCDDWVRDLSKLPNAVNMHIIFSLLVPEGWMSLFTTFADGIVGGNAFNDKLRSRPADPQIMACVRNFNKQPGREAFPVVEDSHD